jgi:carbon-monoxide dehydrogenase large subunit
MRFNADGQPSSATLADYLVPGAPEVPGIRVIHMETPSPYTKFGQKGLGEGGAIAPPAVIANAINDALKGIGVEILVSPVTPDRIIAAIRAANRNPRAS